MSRKKKTERIRKVGRIGQELLEEGYDIGREAVTGIPGAVLSVPGRALRGTKGAVRYAAQDVKGIASNTLGIVGTLLKYGVPLTAALLYANNYPQSKFVTVPKYLYGKSADASSDIADIAQMLGRKALGVSTDQDPKTIREIFGFGIGGAKPRRKMSKWQAFVKKHSPAVMRKYPGISMGEKMSMLSRMYNR